MVLRTDTNNDPTPTATEAVDSSPANIVELPTDRNPSTPEKTITGRSMKVFRWEYKVSAFL
jgi:hypothetical protein